MLDEDNLLKATFWPAHQAHLKKKTKNNNNSKETIKDKTSMWKPQDTEIQNDYVI